MEAAVKLARQYFLELGQPQHQRTHFISRRQSYHGITLGALAVGGHEYRRANFEPLLMKNVSRVSPCNAFRGKKAGETDDKYVARLAKELDDEFQAVGPDTVCAFIAEPVVGAVGVFPSVDSNGANQHHAGARMCDLSLRVLQGGTGCVPKVWRSANSGRGYVRHGPNWNPTCLGARGDRPRHPDHRQGPGRWLPTRCGYAYQ